MQHWIIDTESRWLESWREGLPGAVLLSRLEAIRQTFPGSGICWHRLRAGEQPNTLALVRHSPTVRNVVLCDEPSDALTLQLLSAGALGCCNTYAAPEVLQHVEAVVGNGGLWIGQGLLQQVLASTSRALATRAEPAQEEWPADVSEREMQVARLVAKGGSNKEIARQLDISERTVKAHLTALFEKLGVRDRLQLSLRVNRLKDIS